MLQNYFYGDLILMNNVEQILETANKLSEEFDYEMASVYFQRAVDIFIQQKNFVEALKCSQDLLRCFELLERDDMIDSVKKTINMIRSNI